MCNNISKCNNIEFSSNLKNKNSDVMELSVKLKIFAIISYI